MRHITNCFNRDLAKLRSQAVELETVHKLIMQYIPTEIKPNCQVSAFNAGCLILTVNDAIWASQLRFMLPEIRDKLRKEANLYQLSSIKVKINRDLLINHPKKNQQKPSRPSPWSDILKDLKSAPSHPEHSEGPPEN